ncbi:MAG: hypothetical protein ABRQ24_01680 [Syntrophomonadaceae bacterium]
MVDSKQNLAKSIDMANNAADKMWDLWLAGLKTYDWSHEKLDNMARVQLDLNKAAREDAIRMLQETAARVRRNQNQFQRMFEEAVLNTYEPLNVFQAFASRGIETSLK